MGISRGGFIKLERGERRLTSGHITRAADVFEVPASAVFQETPSIPVMGKIGAGALIDPDYEQVPEDGLYTVDLPFSIPDEIIGFQVEGDSMMPRYDDGDVILVWREQRRPIESFLGEEAAIRTEDGRRYLKTLSRGSGRGLYTLQSFNARPIEAVSVAWVGEIYVTVRRGQLQRIEQRSSKRNR